MQPYFKKKGFTLVEMLVSVSIVTIILSVLLFNQSIYTDVASINNLADDISLSIAQAQAYGIGVRELTPGSADFTGAYGVAFRVIDPGEEKAYILFADKNDNQVYDGDWSCAIGPTEECIGKVDIPNNNSIGPLCRVRDNLNNPYNCTSIGGVDISFSRPSVEAQIKYINSGGNPMDDEPEFIGARVGLVSPRGATSSVLIYDTGQISSITDDE